jgi:aldose 1-epimerase
VAEVDTLGARLHGLSVPDRWGHSADVVLAPGDSASARGPVFGATVGRCASRVPAGRLLLKDVTHQLDTQEDGHTTDGGPHGFDRRLWHCRPFHSANRTGVRLFLHSPDGDQGFPGALDAQVTYTLDRDDNLTLSYQAVTDAPTAVDLANHIHWNLEGHSRGNVLAHHLRIDAPLYVPLDGALLPAGPRRPVNDSPFDLRRARRLSDSLTWADPQLSLVAGGFDHDWILYGSAGRARLRRAAVLDAPVSGRRLEVRTTEPGLRVRTGHGLSGDVIGKSGRPYRAYAGVVLQPHRPPASPGGTGGSDLLLRPGEVYRSTTVFSFRRTGT